ncbi:MAG: hypothetical protein HY666_06575 [Chloroflexi bacterium]|nr:hypothetical protein [Chloroflexota bacterium]
MADKVLEIDYQSGEYILRFRPKNLRVVSEATVDHLKTANKEVLLALRDLLDKAIERMEPQDKTSGRKRTKVEVKDKDAPD